MDIAITVEERWLNDVRRRVEGACWRRRRRSEPPTIYRIPGHMRDADPKSYDTKFVSLGPYHSGDARLKAVDELKWLYLKDFLSRNPDKDLACYVQDVKALKDRAFGAYSEQPRMEGTKFVEMLLLDGCFVVELLIKRAEKGGRQGAKRGEEDDGTVEEDPIRRTTWAFPLVVQDMLLLENQLPFFVLQCLFDSVSSTVSFSLTDLALEFFADKLPEDVKMSSVAPTTFHHLLHLYHYYFLNVEQLRDDHTTICQRLYRVLIYVKNLPSLIWRTLLSLIKALCLYLMKLLCCGSARAESTPDTIPCVTELADAGIKFRRKEGTSVVDITFEDGHMEIPQLHIYDETNSLFRNMKAFEQLYPDPEGTVGASVTSYAAVMEAMINSAEDVALLRREGVVVNELGDEDEAAKLFSRLCKEVPVFKEERYVKLIGKVNEHCSSKINRWRAKLNRDYFGNPWAIISVAAAFFLLLLTVAQTLFTILSYVHPCN